MKTFFKNGPSRARSILLKKAVLAAFLSPAVEVEAQFAGFNAADWEHILYWLDISGLALYLLHRLTELGLTRCLPEQLLRSFQGDLDANRVRTQALFDEAAIISDALRQRGITFAILKGITLSPDSVPDCALRWQIDLDLLVASSDATAARHVLMTHGYALHAVCGNTMEFTAGQSGAPDIRKIYRVHSQRSLELHMLSTSPGRNGQRTDRLARAQLRSFDCAPASVLMPALAPADILAQQSLHLFKHLCSEHTRASWVLEFWQHVETRRHDPAFWADVERIASLEPQGELALGIAFHLSALVFGSAHDQIAQTAVAKLPQNIRLWIETYGLRVLLADSHGNKLYLILRQELRSDASSRPAIRRLVFPAHLPPAITRGIPDEPLMDRLSRYRTQIRFLFRRLHFHVVEGLRYAIELSRWQRRLTETSR
jgi:hypothetical protein